MGVGSIITFLAGNLASPYLKNARFCQTKMRLVRFLWVKVGAKIVPLYPFTDK